VQDSHQQDLRHQDSSQPGSYQQDSRQQDSHQQYSHHQSLAGQIWICPTPLGNLGDMTPRALDALRQADVVCAEDTRVTGKLLHAFDIHAHLVRMDENTIAQKAPGIVDRVLHGENVAYCSDAGMPGVSDPGMKLVQIARQAGAPVTVLPGPTAGATAYVASGFSCPHYLFYGFFPRKPGERTRVLKELAHIDAALIFYESPRRLTAALNAIAQAFPTRRVAVCRELTKIHEEVYIDSAKAVADEFTRRESAGQIRGEIVIVVDAPTDLEKQEEVQDAQKQAEQYARECIAEGKHSKRDIADEISERFHLSRNRAYRLVQSIH